MTPDQVRVAAEAVLKNATQDRHNLELVHRECMDDLRAALAAEQESKRVEATEEMETWKHTIVVFGTGDGPDIDQMLRAEQHAVIALGGTRSVARGGLIEDGEAMSSEAQEDQPQRAQCECDGADGGLYIWRGDPDWWSCDQCDARVRRLTDSEQAREAQKSQP